MQAPRKGRDGAILDILDWQAADPFWTLPQVVANRRAWLEQLSDDDLRVEWKKFRPPRLKPAH